MNISWRTCLLVSVQVRVCAVLDYPCRFSHHMAGYLKSPAPPVPPHHQFHPPHHGVQVPGLTGTFGLPHTLDSVHPAVGFSQGECLEKSYTAGLSLFVHFDGVHVGVPSLLTLGVGVGGQNWPWVLGISEAVKLEGENWFEPALNIHTPLSPTLTPNFLCSRLHFSSQKRTILKQKKYYEGREICLPLPLPSPRKFSYINSRLPTRITFPKQNVRHNTDCVNSVFIWFEMGLLISW